MTAIRFQLQVYEAVLVGGAVVVAVYVLRFLKRGLDQRRFMEGKPQPPAHPIFGHLPTLAGLLSTLPPDIHPHTYAYYLQQRHQLGRVFYLNAFPFSVPQVMILDGEVAQQVTMSSSYTTPHGNACVSLPKFPGGEEVVGPVAGQGSIINLEGGVWRAWRGLLAPGFSRRNVWGMVPEIVEMAERLVRVLEGVAGLEAEVEGEGEKKKEKVKVKGVVRLEEIFTRFTIDVIGKVVLGEDFEAQLGNGNPLVSAFRSQLEWLPDPTRVRLVSVLDVVTRGVLWWNGRVMVRWLEGWMGRKFPAGAGEGAGGAEAEKKAVVDLAFSEYLERKRRGEKGEGEKTNTAVGWDAMDQDFRDKMVSNIRALIFAGHDTTSSHLCYTLHLLQKTPRALTRVLSELNQHLPVPASQTGRHILTHPTLLTHLTYTTSALKESLRLYPPASTVRHGTPGTTVTDPTTGLTHALDNCMVWVVHFGLHRQSAGAEAYPATEFWPERWLDADSAPASAAFRPFEKGPRACIGLELAQLENVVALAMVLRRFAFAAAYEDPEWRGKLFSFVETEEEGVEKGRCVFRHTPVKRARAAAKEEVDGEYMYQVMKATAKPKEGMPCFVALRE